MTEEEWSVESQRLLAEITIIKERLAAQDWELGDYAKSMERANGKVAALAAKLKDPIRLAAILNKQGYSVLPREQWLLINAESKQQKAEITRLKAEIDRLLHPDQRGIR